MRSTWRFFKPVQSNTPKSSKTFQVSSTSTQLYQSMKEIDRQACYNERNYTWPIPLENYKPPTVGWKEMMERRFDQISQLKSSNEKDLTMKYNGWVSAVTSAYVLDNFTEYGWGLARAPEFLMEELREKLLEGVKDGVDGEGMRLEHEIEIILNEEGDSEKNEGIIGASANHTKKEENLPAMFIDLPKNLTDYAMESLRPMHSKWANTPLDPNGKSYGLRLYRNNSRLLMHTDRCSTRVIASILHVGSSDDAKDWPIVLEDWSGNTYEIILEVGDLLFYEAAKLYHGRPRPFQGSWYTSLLTHYYPLNWDTQNYHWEGHYAVPPIWFEERNRTVDSDRLEVVGTGLNEPDCEDGWGGLERSILLRGPAEEGIVLSPKDLMQRQSQGVEKQSEEYVLS